MEFLDNLKLIKNLWSKLHFGNPLKIPAWALSLITTQKSRLKFKLELKLLLSLLFNPEWPRLPNSSRTSTWNQPDRKLQLQVFQMVKTFTSNVCIFIHQHPCRLKKSMKLDWKKFQELKGIWKKSSSNLDMAQWVKLREKSSNN